MEQGLVPSLTLIRSLHSSGIVIEELGRESIVVGSLIADLPGPLRIGVAEHQAQCGLRVASQAVELIAETFDVVHGVKNYYALWVNESLYV